MLVSAAQLETLLTEGSALAVDCRFDFGDTNKGRSQWSAGRIPGAAYAHLDDDLSSPILEHTGRHPLPATSDFAAFLARIGWTPDRLLVAYDEGPNAIAARLWWLMRYHGQSAALLDGGLAGWTASGRSLESGAASPSAAVAVDLRPDSGMTSDAAEILSGLEAQRPLVVDARASLRFSGEEETLDTRAGHIPGALNRPFGANLALGGRFKDPATLREEFLDLLDGRDPAEVVHSCGSGVTACHNLFAMEWAGLAGSRVYPGSWSEWIRDPSRPIATGR